MRAWLARYPIITFLEDLEPPNNESKVTLYLLERYLSNRETTILILYRVVCCLLFVVAQWKLKKIFPEEVVSIQKPVLGQKKVTNALK